MTNRVHRGEERSRAVSRPAELEGKQKTICCSFILQRRVKKSLANSSQTRGGECTSSADRACDLKCVHHMDIGIEECRYCNVPEHLIPKILSRDHIFLRDLLNGLTAFETRN